MIIYKIIYDWPGFQIGNIRPSPQFMSGSSLVLFELFAAAFTDAKIHDDITRIDTYTGLFRTPILYRYVKSIESVVKSLLFFGSLFSPAVSRQTTWNGEPSNSSVSNVDNPANWLLFQLLVYPGSCIEQCFSTFWASSPGKSKIFKLLSRSNFFVMILPLQGMFQYSKALKNIGFA